MNKRLLLLFCGLMIMFQTLPAAEEIKLEVKEKTLDNGMRILVVENHIAPVVSTYLRFRVGSVDEQTDITGISHFLEHMQFKGSQVIGTSNYDAEVPLMKKIDSLAMLLRAEKAKLQNPLLDGDEELVVSLREQIAETQAEQAQYIIKDELWETYLKNGGSRLNASTGNNGTQYYCSLPSNRLELWAFMEADRMSNLVFREFYSERDVVREERRLSLETQPFGVLYEAINAAAHWTSPYRWPVLGWATDMENYLLEDMRKYREIYYAPSNAIACIVGDVKADDVFALCEKYFGPIPAKTLPPPVFAENAPQMGQRTVEVEFDANPSAMAAWHMPQLGHPDVPALDVLSDILSRGRTSRLYKNIVEKKLGRARASISMARYPDLFMASATPMGDHTCDDVLQAVYTEIERIKTEKVEQWEIDKVRSQADADFIRGLNSNMGLARRIGNMEAMVGDWHYLTGYRDLYKSVTPDDISRVAAKYLTKRNRTVVTLVKKEIEPGEEDQTAEGGAR